MSNSLRSIKRQQDRASDELPLDQQKLPTGRILTEPLRGTYSALPLLAWMAVRDRDRVPLVMMVLALLDSEDFSMKGTLELELPLYADTEAATLAVLERYGWTGAVWAMGDPPPLDNSELGEQLKGLLEQTSTKLRATLVFGPDPATGNAMAQTVEVARAKGRFLMPPLEAPTEPIHEGRQQILRDLVLNYRTFFEADKNDVRESPT